MSDSPSQHAAKMRVAAIIPCFRVKRFIVSVLEGIGDDVDKIYVVDDCCPEGTADHVEANYSDPRLTIIRHEQNKGVGGAVMSGTSKRWRTISRSW